MADLEALTRAAVVLSAQRLAIEAGVRQASGRWGLNVGFPSESSRRRPVSFTSALSQQML